ncbi:MAG: Fic family protein [Planctomycetaceae bacterium]
MRIPQSPPPFEELLKEAIGKVGLFESTRAPEVVSFLRKANDQYLHWHKFRYYPMPEGLTPRECWLALQFTRMPNFREIPIAFYDGEAKIRYWSPPQHLEWLHKIDQQAGGVIGTQSRYSIPDDQERYLWNSLMEEAIASSQLEGASTTREVAKKMLRQKRKPRDRSEKMILNNYRAIQEIRDLKGEKLTPKLLCQLQAIITDGTLDNPEDCGRLRQAGDHEIRVEDTRDNTVLHRPPGHHHVEWRVDEICDFANEKTKPFLHPVLKAIMLHFAIGFVHPFVDGNGRTARAIFYWYILKSGYWLFEYLPISRIFLHAPVQYTKAFLYSETDGGDVTYFIHYHLGVVERAICDLYSYLDKQQREVQDAANILRKYPYLNHRQTALLHDAIRHPGRTYTLASHAGSHNVVLTTARKDLFQLEEKGFLERAKLGRQLVFYPVDSMVKKIRKIKSTDLPPKAAKPAKREPRNTTKRRSLF